MKVDEVFFIEPTPMLLAGAWRPFLRLSATGKIVVLAVMLGFLKEARWLAIGYGCTSEFCLEALAG